MTLIDIDIALRNTAAYLFKDQQKDGNFLSYTSKDPVNFSDAKTLNSTFTTSLILSSITNCKNINKLKTVRKKAAAFLLSQKSNHCSWNYWLRDSLESKTTPYPDDLDDTFCALSALQNYNKNIIDSNILVESIQLLTSLEQKEGGPYFSWIVAPNADRAWRDIDLVVNSNIAYFLSLNEVSLPRLESFIEEAITDKKFISPYYATDYSVIYFISRFYKGKKSKEIIEYVLSKQTKDGGFGNILDTALAITALINLGYPQRNLKRNIDLLLSECKKNYWRSYPFVIELMKNDEIYYSGSPALTCAFVLEALSKIVKQSASKQEKAKKKNQDESKKIHNEVINQLTESIETFGPEFKAELKNILRLMNKGIKKNSITLLPYYFYSSLRKEIGHIPTEKLIKLGSANLYGWIAYTIYDDFLDNEGNPTLLSIANFALRQLTQIFNEISPASTEFRQFFTNTLNEMDNVNTWEVKKCRLSISGDILKIPKILPDFGDFSCLEKRSMGHALGPIAILSLLNFNKKSQEFFATQSFFRNFIIAKQLNDDIHDWEEDLKRGQINSIGAIILKKLKKKQSNKVTINLKSEIIKLQKIFWYEVSDDVCKKILYHVELARKDIGSVEIFEDFLLFEKLLSTHEQSAKAAINERKNTIDFLNKFESSPD